MDHPAKGGFASLRALSEVLAELCLASTQEEAIRIGASYARRLCEIDGLSLVLSSGQQCHDLASSVPRPEYVTLHSRMLTNLLEWVTRSRRTAIVPDASNNERMRPYDESATPVRSLVAVPIGGRPMLGTVVVYWTELHWPDAPELLVIESLAHAIGLAVRRPVDSHARSQRSASNSVTSWLDTAADAEGLRGKERERALMAAEIRHQVRNVLSLIRTTARMEDSASNKLGVAFDAIVTQALTLSALHAPQGDIVYDKRESVQAGSQDLTGRAVLVVEDDYFIAEEVCAALREHGAHIVGPAPDIDTARALAEGHALDCAVLDVNLQGEAVFALAGEPRARGVPTIFATGYDAAFLPTTFRDSVYLQKPIDIAALFRAVKNVRGHSIRPN